MGKTTQTMVLDRVTKNAARFAAQPEQGKAAAVNSIYVQKWALGESVNALPLGDIADSTESISLTIEV